MKVLILDRQKQLFLTRQGLWTEKTQDAQDFAFTAHARSVAQTLELKDFQILFYFPDINYRIVVGESIAAAAAA